VRIGLAIDHILHAAHRLDARLQRGLELVVDDRLLAALIDGGLDHLAHDRLAELLLEEGDRRLAGRKPLRFTRGFISSRRALTRPSSSLTGR
jgi:hypothetical protein